MRRDRMRTVGLVMVIVLALALGAWAQDVTAPAPPPAAEKKVAELEAQIKALQAQVARASQPTLEQQIERARTAFTEAFATAKKQAEPGCRSAGGKLTVSIDATGKVGVSCAF